MAVMATEPAMPAMALFLVVSSGVFLVYALVCKRAHAHSLRPLSRRCCEPADAGLASVAYTFSWPAESFLT